MWHGYYKITLYTFQFAQVSIPWAATETEEKWKENEKKTNCLPNICRGCCILINVKYIAKTNKMLNNVRKWKSAGLEFQNVFWRKHLMETINQSLNEKV